MAVIVPLGNRPLLGFVTAKYMANSEELGFDVAKLRPPLKTVEGIYVPESTMALAKFVSEQYLCKIPVALQPAIPPGIKERLETSWKITKKGELYQEKLPVAQEEALRVLKESDGILRVAKSKKLLPGMEKALKAMRATGLVSEVLSLPSLSTRSKSKEVYRLTSNQELLEHHFTTEWKKKPAQTLVLMTMRDSEDRALSSAELRAMTGVTESTLKALVSSKLLVPVEGEGVNLGRAPEPNRNQRLAIDAISDSIRDQAYKSFLLFGVTGSGKTEVYLRAATEALSLGKQVLYLVPEIALATQAVSRLRERFGKGVAIVHSELPAGERLENYLRILQGEASIVLGARSGLFAPLSDVGLIIVDEEHETTYKQESAPRYHAKKLAQFLGSYHNCPVVLGSATPSVESFYEAEQDKLTLLSLPGRAAPKSKLPEVDIEDLTEGFRSKQPALISQKLLTALQETIEKKEQAILFLNRRAFAPSLLCRECGHTMACPNCAITLSLHRKANRLKCHHCDFWAPVPDICPACQGYKLKALGVGTEQVEETLKQFFPNANLARLDRDVAQKKGAIEEILAAVGSGEVQILVGTQMVAKGLDFAGVTLVGVVAADISLNIPDFRSSERTFQLLCQVSGRAGRSDKPGRAIIQTFNSTHPAVLAAKDQDYLALYEYLIKERREALYPPFCRLVNIFVTGTDRSVVLNTSEKIGDSLRASSPPEVQVLGPTDCVLERLNNRWRRHVLIKLPVDAEVSWVETALGRVSNSEVQVVVDVDAYNMA